MKDQKRGKNVAVVGAVLQAIIVVVVVILWRMSDSHSAFTSLWLLVGGVFLWLMTVLLFYARQLERQEAVDLQELIERGGGEGTIFEEQEKLDLRPARQRLEFLLRWIVPVFTLLFAAYHATLGLLMIRYLRTAEPLAASRPMETALFLLIIGFGAFLFSRYCTGMSSQPQWRLLRATGSYLLICVLFIWSAAAGMLFVSQGVGQIETIVAFILPGIQLIFAAELLLNFVLDIYRPRAPGSEDRPSFDSRLLGLFSEPGGLAHTLAEAINYQFGFEVSKTWFYRLLQRAITPLIAFGLVTMLLLTAVVVVEVDEQAIVERFGQPVGGRAGVLGPGIYLKLPSPVDSAYKYPVERLQEIVLGFSKQPYRHISQAKLANELKLILWTSERHGQAPELLFVAASRQLSEQDDDAVVPSLINANVPVQFRISDVFDYHYNYTNPRELLEAIAYHELVLYVAGTNLDDLLGADRFQAAEYLKQRIQHQADQLKLGVTITFIGWQNIHPPREGQVAESFQEVIGALAEKEARIRRAEAKENEILAKVAGGKKLALDLVAALEHIESLRDSGAEQERLDIARQRVQRLFNGYYVDQRDGRKRFVPGVAGQAAALVARARAYRWKRENEVQGKAERFRKELTAYRSSPRFFKLRKYLQALSEGLAGARKYVVAADTKKIPMVIEFDLKSIPRPDIETFEPSQ